MVQMVSIWLERECQERRLDIDLGTISKSLVMKDPLYLDNAITVSSITDLNPLGLTVTDNEFMVFNKECRRF